MQGASSGSPIADLFLELSTQESVSSPKNVNPATKQPSTFELELIEILGNDNDIKLESVKNLRGEPALKNIVFRGFNRGRILHAAVQIGAIKCLQLLLTYDLIKTCLESPDGKGRTSLLVAVICSRVEALDILLREGANVNARDDDHYGVLHLLLLELYNSKTEERREQLLKVADVFLPETNTRLTVLENLDMEPHANFSWQEDATPLSAVSALLYENDKAEWVNSVRDLCERMMRWGAKYSRFKRELQSSGIKIEKDKGHKIEKRSPPRSLEVRVIDEVCRGCFDNLKKELSNQPEEEAFRAVNSRVGKYSLLFWGVEKRNDDIVRLLLEKGAKVEANGNLAIRWAAHNGLSTIFELLLDQITPITQDDKDRLMKILEDKKSDDHNKCLELIQKL